MLTSVVIPCLDGAADTRACLESLREQRDAGEVEVILVDNGSRDPQALAAAAQAFAPLQLLRLPHNLGFAGGVNRGLAAARGDVLVVLNNDTMVAPTMLARLLRAREAQPRPTLLAPVSNYVKGAAHLPVGQRGADAAGRAQLEAELDAQFGAMLQDVESLAGLCLMFDRATLATLGGFDEVFGLGNYEDDDLSLRARLRGARLVVVRSAFVHHRGSRTFKALGVDYDGLLARNQEVMDAKWADEPAWAALRALARNDVPAAAELAQRALARHPHWPEGQLILAQAALANNAADAALAHAQRFLTACPNHWNGHAVLVAARLLRGELAQASSDTFAALTRCHATPQHAADLLARLAWRCAELGEVAAAVPALQASLDLHHDAARQTWLGQLLRQQGDLAGAEAAFAVAAADAHAPALQELASCQWQSRRYGQALQNLLRAVASDGNDATARQNLRAALAWLAEAGVDVERAQAVLATEAAAS